MVEHHEITCPCCGDSHAVGVLDIFGNPRSAHLDDRGMFFNYLGCFRRPREVERRCPETGALYHIDCDPGDGHR